MSEEVGQGEGENKIASTEENNDKTVEKIHQSAEDDQEKELSPSAKLLASLLDEPNPFDVPLTAKFKRGFGYKTIGHRLPVILTKVIDQLSRDKNELSRKHGVYVREEVKTIVGLLARLKNEMQTNKSIRKVHTLVWDSYIEEMATLHFDGEVDDVKWYFAPWLFVECYLYRRINDAFLATRVLKFYDIFRKPKEDSWLQSIEAAALLGEFITTAEPTPSNLQKFLEISLWGNKCDLSISVGDNVSQEKNPLDQLLDLKKFILCDDSERFWEILNTNKGNNSSIGYVLDNAGFELFTDLCFADALMNVVERIDFHFKDMPWFVSDAMVRDFNWMLESMAMSDKLVLVRLATKWRNYVSSGRWTQIEHEFWTFPHAYFEMKSLDPKLYATLGENTHLIFKGDLNYRKLIGDVNWRPDTSFKESLRGFCPSPLIALRTLKADCVSGLAPGVAEKVAKENPDWMVTGEYGVIQHCA